MLELGHFLRIASVLNDRLANRHQIFAALGLSGSKGGLKMEFSRNLFIYS